MNITRKETGIELLSPGVYRIKVRIRVGGKIIGRTETIEGIKEAARERRQALKREIRENKPACSLKVDLKQFKHVLEIYRAEFLKENGYSFSKGHESNVRIIAKELGECEVLCFADRFERYLGLIRGQGKLCMANRFIEIARAAFQRCVDRKIISVNPIIKELFPETKQIARDVYLPPEEVRNIILTAAKNPRTFHIARALQFFFSVPCRKMEVVRMKVSDVNIFAGKIRVHNGTTKNDQGTWKPIPPIMMKWFIRRLREKQSNDEPVFYREVSGSRKDRSKETRRIEPLGDFKNAWYTVRAACGHPKLHLHDSRHCSATFLINQGTPRTVVNEVAGWKTDMLQTYYHSDSDAAFSSIRWGDNQKRELPVQSLNLNLLKNGSI